jgi:hypothetical protein
MSLIGIGCSKKTRNFDNQNQGISYQSIKTKMSELDKKVGKTRTLLPNTNSMTVSPNIPIPVITKFMYCLSGPSPLGSNYIRFKYRVDVDNITKFSVQGLPINVNDRNPFKKQLEYRLYNQSVYGFNQGYKVVLPYGTANASCVYVDLPITATTSALLYINASIQTSNSTSPSAIYNIYGYGTPIGFVAGTNSAPTSSISKTYIVDSWDGTNICP